MNFIQNIAQFGFIASIIFMLYILIGISIKIYGKFVENENAKFILTSVERILLWISLAYMLTYMFS